MKHAREDILPTMKKVCDWQLAHLPETYFHLADEAWRVIQDNGWIRSAFFTGVMAAFRATNDPKYLDAAKAWAQRNDWAFGARLRHADYHSCGQVYLDIYLHERDSRMIESLRAVFDPIVEDPMLGSRVGWKKSRNWSWCDALFMAPPVMARLAAATGNRAYLDTMNLMWWDAHAYLFDERENLFYRDARFKPDATPAILSPNGRPVFWSRGNGWAMAGTARVLEFMPEDYADRGRYIDLFRRMAERLAVLQSDDGLWRPNLLDPDSYPDPETSGSGFFCYAFAWGVARGLLPATPYLATIRKAWRGLLASIDEDGILHRVQSVGAIPSRVSWEDTAEYGVGAFLLAASEVANLP